MKEYQGNGQLMVQIKLFRKDKLYEKGKIVKWQLHPSKTEEAVFMIHTLRLTLLIPTKKMFKMDLM